MRDMKKLVVVAIVALLAFSLYRKNESRKVGTEENVEVAKNEVMSQKTMTKVPATYKVQAGEGLWHVAVKEMGSGEKWVELASANSIKKPYIIHVGQELKIPNKEIEVESTTEVKSYTIEQVAEHDNKDNCWLAIEGNVYDVTPYISSGFHPGKAAILLGCGKDATVLFNTRPMGSGTAHSERARSFLPKYLVGNLEE